MFYVATSEKPQVDILLQMIVSGFVSPTYRFLTRKWRFAYGPYNSRGVGIYLGYKV